MKRPLPLHPFMFGVLFVIVAYREISPYGSVAELGRCLFFVFAGVFILQWILQKIFHEPFKGAILTSLFVVLFCFFGDLKMHFEKVLMGTAWEELSRARYILILSMGLSVWLAKFVVQTNKNLLSIKKYLNVTSVLMVAVTAGQIGVSISQRPSPSFSKEKQTPLSISENPPDIYYILTDAYTSSESLREFWNYDNSPFTDFLSTNGFFVLSNARANADSTPICLSTYLNMSYPPPPSPKFSAPARLNYYCDIIEHSEAASRLKVSGYEIVNLSLFRVAGLPNFYSYPGIGTTTLSDLLVEKTIAGYFQSYRKRLSFAGSNLAIFNRLSEIAAQKREKPRFVYAHLMMPHRPYLFDRQGNRVVRGMSQVALKKEDYLDQLIYGNTLLTNAISAILKNSQTPPIIVVQGDHGFRYLRDEHRLKESMTILNAIHLPEAKKDWIYEGMTPVNTFRLIFNHCFGANYEYLPDHPTSYLGGGVVK